ncbi:hypothetical protein SAMN06264849_101494 [Melghirimyces algeriensis]|uniref:Uncharacterized protein n=1 Tax=Melghirimyces algeriensis TaxID=910412 RepID=A0A521B2D1_9BACL|nr:hypothetical protein SAMN06264849_101494 [Melghirimyces algeriensis]
MNTFLENRHRRKVGKGRFAEVGGGAETPLAGRFAE